MSDPLSALKNNPTLIKMKEEQDTKVQRLKDASHQMEGFFVGELLKQMSTKITKGGLIEDNSQTQMFKDMFYETVGKEIGKQGRFGIADMLYKQLEITVKGKESGDDTK